MKKILLIRFGELFLKGNNRSYFMSTLARNMRIALRGTDGVLIAAQGRYFVETEDVTLCSDRIRAVFGVHSVSPCIECEKDIETIAQIAIEMMRTKQGSFKVSARRSDKTFALNSMEINCEIGYLVHTALPHLTVDVHHPDHTLEVEIREHAYLHVGKLPAAGGMPVGTGGRAMLLLSGGIDSPVAGYRMAKRGVTIDCVHFHSFPFTSEQAKQKVIDLATILTRFCGPMRLHIVPFTEIQQALHEQCPESQLTLLMRRHMMRIAETIAIKRDCGALITGESLGQVASQTMASLHCTGDVCKLPIFRPLIGYDKQEIVQHALEIGTYETSILPYEDCCTIFTPKHPNTRPNLQKIYESETIFEYEPMLERAIENTQTLLITMTKQSEVR